MIDKEKLDKINKILVKRYDDKFQKFGMDPRSLGWGIKEDQITRFSVALESIDFSNKSVIDIGCGFSDFYNLLKEREIPIRSYKGIDINPTFIQTNKKNCPQNEYEVRDILINPFDKPVADVGVMFGLLNFNFKENINNVVYAKEFIKKNFFSVKECLIVDMLSNRLTFGYEKEDFVFYYSPEEMLKFCLTLTENVILRHDYKPIPQKEFMLILKKGKELIR